MTNLVRGTMRLRIHGAMAAVAMLQTAPSMAQANDARLSHHLQCFVAMSALTQVEDPKAKASGLMASMFFAGQVFGASPNIDLLAALRRESAQLDDARIGSLLKECGAEMAGRGAQITTAGDTLSAEARDKTKKN